MTVVAPDPVTPTASLRFADADHATAPGPGSGGGHLPYFPAIEGLRGIAVVGVLLFHAGYSWMQGGYLGVSTFFTLSGFLITSLLLAERGATGAVDLRGFWLRRFRRLMPAALGALALALLFGILGADAVQKRNLSGDVLAALAYVANWRFLLSDQSYGDLFGQPSPVLHFWSLAIEEQFYLLYPLLAWFVLQREGRRRQLLGAVLLGLAALSLGLTLFGGLSQDAVYFSTATRAVELLVGALLAVGIYHRRVTHVLAGHRQVQVAIAATGALALAGSVALWVTTSQRSGWLYQGGLAGYSLLSAAVILAAITPFGPVRWLLALRPLRELGRVSYGIYLYHWPVFLWISDERLGWSPWIVMPLRLAVTAALAALSYRYLEMPVRRGQTLLGARPAALAPLALSGLIVAVIAISVTAPKPVIDFDEAAVAFQHNVESNAPPPKPIDPTAADAPFPRIALFGDSTALMTGLGMSAWGAESKKADFVDGAAWLGCGLGRGGERRSGEEEGPIPARCNHWERTWGQKITNFKPNIAIVQIGPWEVADRKLEGDTVWRKPGDKVYDDYLLQEMQLAVDTLSAEGADVIWLTSPPVGAAQGSDAVMIRGQGAEPQRMVRLNELIAQLPALRPGKVSVVDLAGWLAASGEDARLRPDGVHFGQQEGKEVAERWLGQTVIDTYKADWKRRQVPGSTTTGGTAPSAVPGTAPTGTAPSSTPSTGAPSSTTYDGPKRTILVLGDTAADRVADALSTWAASSGTIAVERVIQPSCGILPTTQRRHKATLEPTPTDCASQIYGWLQSVVSVKPDIVLVVPSVWDLTDVQLEGDEQLRALGDPAVTDAMWKQMLSVSASLQKTGAIVGWLNAPAIEWGRADDPPPAVPHPASDPVRVQQYNELLDKLTLFAGHERQVSRIDFARFARNWPADRPPLFPDGHTLGPDVTEPVGAWLGPELLVFYDEHEASGD